MPKKDFRGNDLVIRDMPDLLLRQIRMSSAASGMTLKDLIIAVLQQHVTRYGVMDYPAACRAEQEKDIL